MAANSALFIVCLFGCDLISMSVIVCVCWLTMDAPSVGFPVFYLSIYMRPSGFHAAWNSLNESFFGVVCRVVYVWVGVCIGAVVLWVFLVEVDGDGMGFFK